MISIPPCNQLSRPMGLAAVVAAATPARVCLLAVPLVREPRRERSTASMLVTIEGMSLSVSRNPLCPATWTDQDLSRRPGDPKSTKKRSAPSQSASVSGQECDWHLLLSSAQIQLNPLSFTCLSPSLFPCTTIGIALLLSKEHLYLLGRSVPSTY